MKRTTLARAVFCEGIGLQTGENISLQFQPALDREGIWIERLDLPGEPLVPVNISHVVDEATRTTNIANGNVKVYTVEHLMAALAGCGIDDLVIQLRGSEIPIMDGSARDFVKAFEAAGIREKDAEKDSLYLKAPVFYSEGQKQLVALPSDRYQISCLIHYPKNPLISSQYFSTEITPEIFKSEIAPCRTFCLHEEITFMRERGLMKGGSLANAVVIDGENVLNPEGLRFADEMVRHKMLDILGDLSLVGRTLKMHIIAICPSHRANAALARKLVGE